MVAGHSDRHARHPVNALLNYGYAVLKGQVGVAIAEAGLDPTIGYLHVCQPGRQALVYDLMEPHRPEVDREVLGFVRLQTFTPRDFVIDTKGVCRLHPELAKTVSVFTVSEVLLRESVGCDAAGFLVPDTPQGPPGDGLSASENSSAPGRSR